ncbi:flagellar hook-associated protein FlgK [Phenylobacterium sp.]|jgi:flagellar hook-associated protein 1 FlgK|uniref:flagellar hook-associated protein FlgK n=1 Tax=Phenylobacterium sp. TaxID=1871053 RepID=UPI002F42CE24
MTLSSALQISTSGLQAAQAALTAISDNISNVNTPGYTRKTVVQQQQVEAGAGAGVQVVGVKRVTDQYLQAASLSAGSDASSANVYSQFLDNAQTLFGDPTSDDYFFNMPDQISAAFASAANDPSSALLRGQAVTDVQNFLSDADQINTQVSQLQSSVDAKVTDDVNQVNSLLSQIDSLNTDISRAQVSGGDATGSQNIQSQLVNQLSTLMNVKVNNLPSGGVTVRTADGVLLAGGGTGPSTVNYNNSGTTPGYLSVTTGGANSGPQPIAPVSGELGGLLSLRNDKLPGISDQLGEFVSRTAQALNAASNASTASPPPSTLTGRNTGLDLPTALSGFSGQSTVAITDPNGVVQKTVAIDFTNGTMSVNGGPTSGFTPANFLTSLNTALGASGSASFANGQLSISAAGSNGVAIDEGTSQKAGQGFSQFFGLNDLITSTGISTYDTGLSSSDPNGFTPGSTITLQVSTADGKPLQQVTVAVPPAGNPSVGDLVNALNSSSTGIGIYGSFTLDAQGGLAFTGNAPQNATVSVVADNTQRGAGGPSFSQLFGVGQVARAARASSYQVNPAMAADPTKLPLATLNLGVAAGQSAVAPGDGTGALALAQAEQNSILFKAAGDLGNVSMTLSNYAAQFGGSLGRDAATAASNASSATAVQTEADAKRASVEGVNLDEELVNLTTYQQAYSANARMIQATKDLFDVLNSLIS